MMVSKIFIYGKHIIYTLVSKYIKKNQQLILQAIFIINIPNFRFIAWYIFDKAEVEFSDRFFDIILKLIYFGAIF